MYEDSLLTNRPLMNTSNESVVYAGFWIRVVAAIIDTVIALLIIEPIVWAVYGRQYFEGDAFIKGPLDLMLTWVLPMFAVIAFWVYRSATPGKMAVRISIVDARTGGRPSTAQAIGRYLGYFLSIIPFCIGLAWVAFDPRKQGFHDKLAGTVVIHDR